MEVAGWRLFRDTLLVDPLVVVAFARGVFFLFTVVGLAFCRAVADLDLLLDLFAADPLFAVASRLTRELLRLFLAAALEDLPFVVLLTLDPFALLFPRGL